MNAAKQLALAAEALHACGFRGRANKLRGVADELALTEAAFDGIHAQLAAVAAERDALAAFAQGLQVATDSLRAERDALAAKVERVRALHVEQYAGCCNACDSLWPCDTIRALDEEADA